MIYLNDETELNLSDLSAIKFYADWCVPCKRMDTILNKMEKEFEDIKIYSIDIDKYTKIAQKYEVKSLPTIIFFDNGKEKFRLVGVFPTEQVRKSFKALKTQ